MSSTEHVEMEVVDRLATILAGVDHDPIALVHQALFPGDSCSEKEQVAETIRLCGFLDRGDMPTRNDEEMSRSLGIDVTEHQGVVGLRNYVRRNGSLCDPTEDAFLVGGR